MQEREERCIALRVPFRVLLVEARGGYAGAARRGVRHYEEGARRFGVLGSRLRERPSGDSWGLQVGISHYNVSATIGM
jgi:hypothetical protein